MEKSNKKKKKTRLHAMKTICKEKLIHLMKTIGIKSGGCHLSVINNH